MKKKLFASVLLAGLMFGGCSGDNDDTVKTPLLSVNINGIKKDFYNVSVAKEDAGVVQLLAIDETRTETLTCRVELGHLGDYIRYIQYLRNGKLFYETATGVVSNITVGSQTHLKATFSGQLATTGSGGTTVETLTLTDGSVDVTYQVD